MAKPRFEYSDSFRPSPVTFWAYRQTDDEPWSESAIHEPALPRPIPGKGYCYCVVEYQNQEFEFASVHEIRHVIDVLNQKVLPTSTKLSHDVSRKNGPNSHWLSRIPLKSKSYKNRVSFVKVLEAAITEHPRNAI